jgi:hypothetical protein
MRNGDEGNGENVCPSPSMMRGEHVMLEVSIVLDSSLLVKTS